MPLFHAVFDTEWEFYIKFWKIVFWRRDFAHLGQKLDQNWTEWPNHIKKLRKPNETIFPYGFGHWGQISHEVLKNGLLKERLADLGPIFGPRMAKSCLNYSKALCEIDT